MRAWLRRDGYVLAKRKATSHEQYAHSDKPGRVTISGSNNEEPSAGVWKSIRRQARWDQEGKHDV
ncbi:MAG: type II toxin-antitoxin system HicA family toxin [Candidatus Eremiobacteraeota bacterium]|nr:type II toxin-antitoxin system HicA family toxin [Candidatus Eremiobacteraeota bacterium]